eukprot:sb/3474082/
MKSLPGSVTVMREEQYTNAVSLSQSPDIPKEILLNEITPTTTDSANHALQAQCYDHFNSLSLSLYPSLSLHFSPLPQSPSPSLSLLLSPLPLSLPPSRYSVVSISSQQVKHHPQSEYNTYYFQQYVLNIRANMYLIRIKYVL